MVRVLVADKLADEGLQRLREADGVDVDVRIGLDEDELAAAVGDYDGMIIRSGVNVTRKVLANPGGLRAIAGPGVFRPSAAYALQFAGRYREQRRRQEITGSRD